MGSKKMVSLFTNHLRGILGFTVPFNKAAKLQRIGVTNGYQLLCGGEGAAFRIKNKSYYRDTSDKR